MDGSKPHILIVDDEIGPRESLRLILSPHYNVHVAEGGAQGDVHGVAGVVLRPATVWGLGVRPRLTAGVLALAAPARGLWEGELHGGTTPARRHF